MKKPQCVTDYDELKASYKSRGSLRVPKIPPDVREFYDIIKYKNRFKEIASSRDQNLKKIDLEAITEELAFHLKQTHSQHDHNIIFFMKYDPKYLKDEGQQMSQFAFRTDVLTPYKLKLILTLGRNTNLFCTNCTFQSNYSRKSYLAYSSECLILDIDYYNILKFKNKSAEEVYSEICNKVFQPKGLEPAYGIDSGHGLYIVFLTEPLILYDQPLNCELYKQLMSKLIEMTSKYGSDPTCKDLSRVLRLPSCFNLKSEVPRLVKIIDFDTVKTLPLKRYSISELKSLLKIKPQKTEERTAYIRKTTMAKKTADAELKDTDKKTLNSLGQARVRDLRKWLAARNYDIEGKRNTFFLILSNSLMEYMPPAIAFTHIEDINSKLKQPQSKKELEVAFKSVEQSYHDRAVNNIDSFSFTNEYIIDNLEITQKEMETYETIITTEIKRSREYAKRKRQRRNSEGLTKRQKQKRDKILQIQTYLKEGKTKAEIARLMSVSKGLVSIYCKEFNEKVA